MRTFIALNLPAAERRALLAALEPLKQRGLPVRWAEEDGVHLTLKFLGEIDPASITPLGIALQEVAAKQQPIVLQLGGFAAFPSLRRANVLWVGIAADPRLLALQTALENALFTLGYPRDTRPFRPHLTVARTRRGAREPDVSRLVDTFAYHAAAPVDTIDLMRSHLGQGGSRYEPLLKARLGKGEQ